MRRCRDTHLYTNPTSQVAARINPRYKLLVRSELAKLLDASWATRKVLGQTAWTRDCPRSPFLRDTHNGPTDHGSSAAPSLGTRRTRFCYCERAAASMCHLCSTWISLRAALVPLGQGARLRAARAQPTRPQIARGEREQGQRALLGALAQELHLRGQWDFCVGLLARARRSSRLSALPVRACARAWCLECRDFRVMGRAPRRVGRCGRALAVIKERKRDFGENKGAVVVRCI